MPSKEWIKTTIFLFAGALFAVSLLTGNDLQDALLKWTSLLISMITMLLLSFDRWLWKLPGIQYIAARNGHPNISGTWKGTLNFDRDADGNPGSISIFLSIHQTFSTVDVRAYVSTSNSHTVTGRINVYGPSRTILEYAYRTEPPDGTHTSNRITDGLAKLTLVGTPVVELEGSYFTNRNGGSGRIKVDKWNKTNSDSFDQANRRKYSAIK